MTVVRTCMYAVALTEGSEAYAVLVTGAGQGIGEAVARRFAAEGARRRRAPAT